MASRMVDSWSCWVSASSAEAESTCAGGRGYARWQSADQNGGMPLLMTEIHTCYTIVTPSIFVLQGHA